MDWQLLGVGALLGWAVWYVGKQTAQTWFAAAPRGGCGGGCGTCSRPRPAQLTHAPADPGDPRTPPTPLQTTFVPVGELAVRRRSTR